MALIGSYEVAQAVITPLKKSISSLNSVYEALIVADVHPITGYCSNYGYIRNDIEQACWSLQCSDQAASTCLISLDRNLETLTQDEGRLERQKKDTEETLANLRIKQDSNEMILQESRESLNQADVNLDSAKRTLVGQGIRAVNAKSMRISGWVMSLSPITGWFFGTKMVYDAERETLEASMAIKTAKEDIEKFKNQVAKYDAKVSEYNSKISQTNEDIRELNNELGEIRGKVTMMRTQRQYVGEMQNKVRSAVHLLHILSGRVNAMEYQTREFILHEPVVMVMEEILKSTEDFVGHELLGNSGVLRLVDEMRTNNRRLRAVCASRRSDNDMMQYF